VAHAAEGTRGHGLRARHRHVCPADHPRSRRTITATFARTELSTTTRDADLPVFVLRSSAFFFVLRSSFFFVLRLV
jgi:hypothetical protein